MCGHPFLIATAGAHVSPLPLRLTPELVAKGLKLFPPGTRGDMPAGRRKATDSDHAELAASLLAGRDPDNLWVFAIGSLIWNPGFDHVERRTGTAQGWHRAFRLGYDKWFRGSVERPGLMLVLDRGGSCRGVLFRLPPGAGPANLDRLMRREVHLIPHPFPPRWIKVLTDDGPVDTITFAMNRNSPSYVKGLDEDSLVRILATSAGPLGSMAEYLRSTVEQLESMDLRDHTLWRLQERVASYLEDAQP